MNGNGARLNENDVSILLLMPLEGMLYRFENHFENECTQRVAKIFGMTNATMSMHLLATTSLSRRSHLNLQFIFVSEQSEDWDYDPRRTINLREFNADYLVIIKF